MPTEGGEPAKRPRIQLPSFREVQAAQQQSKDAGANSSFFRAGRIAGGAAPSLPPAGAPPGPSTSAAPPPPGPITSAHAAAQPAQRAVAPQPAAALPAAVAGPSSSRGAAGPPSTSYAVTQAPAARSGLAKYQAHNASPNAILVSRRQDGNPLLRHVRNVRWVFADIVPDYIIGADACALFLSMRFHLLKPEYIYGRIKELQRSFRLRVLLCHVDVDDVVEPLQQITRAALLNDVTLICAWSPEECARYLETFKVYETKPADAIQGRTEEDYLSRLNAALTTVRGVNKTDVLTLGNAFDTAARVMQASVEELAACPGIGPTKVKRLHDTFHQPFRRSIAPAAEQPAAAAVGQPQVAGAPSPAAAAAAVASGSQPPAAQPAAPQELPMDDFLGGDGSDEEEFPLG